MAKELGRGLWETVSREWLPLVWGGLMLLAACVWGWWTENSPGMELILSLLPGATLALVLRQLWIIGRPDTLVGLDDYIYPEDILFDEEQGLEFYLEDALEGQEEQTSQETDGERPEQPTEPEPQGAFYWPAMLMMTVLVAGYLLLLPRMGFIPVTLGFFCLLLWLLGENHFVVTGLCSAVSTACAYILWALL